MRRIDLRKVNVARPNTIRDINRQIVLNYVRERGPISRAEIARETVLQRSTVSTIVDELVADSLVEEIGEGESTGGRRPTLLRLRASGAAAVGIDITPTRTTVATSDLSGRVLEKEEFATNPDFEKTVERARLHHGLCLRRCRHRDSFRRADLQRNVRRSRRVRTHDYRRASAGCMFMW